MLPARALIVYCNHPTVTAFTCRITADGRPIGIEIAIPSLVTVEAVNEVLTSYGLQPIDAAELAPLKNAA